LGVRGLSQKSKKKLCKVPHGELTAKKWLNSIEKQKKKKQFKGVCQTDRHPDIWTDRQSELLTIMTARLGTEINRNKQERQITTSTTEGREI